MRMNINDLNEKIGSISKEINFQNRENNFNNLEQIERLIEGYLEHDPHNIELLLRLAVLELRPPLMDTERSISYLNMVLTQDENNTHALILLAFIHNTFYAGMPEDLEGKLKNLQTDNQEYKSIFYYLIARHYYDEKDFEQYKAMLQKSIDLCSIHVYNHVDLGKYYIEKGKIIEGVNLIRKALDNIKHVYSPDEDLDFTDVSTYIAEHIKGTYITEVNLEDLREILHKYNV